MNVTLFCAYKNWKLYKSYWYTKENVNIGLIHLYRFCSFFQTQSDQDFRNQSFIYNGVVGSRETGQDPRQSQLGVWSQSPSYISVGVDTIQPCDRIQQGSSWCTGPCRTVEWGHTVAAETEVSISQWLLAYWFGQRSRQSRLIWNKKHSENADTSTSMTLKDSKKIFKWHM